MLRVVIALLFIFSQLTLSPSDGLDADGFHPFTAAAQATKVLDETDNPDDNYRGYNPPSSVLTINLLDSISRLVSYHPSGRSQEFHQDKLPIFKLHVIFRI